MANPSKRYSVQSSKGLGGTSILVGWVIVEIDGNLYYVKEGW